jgi:hypothetical protein
LRPGTVSRRFVRETMPAHLPKSVKRHWCPCFPSANNTSIRQTHCKKCCFHHRMLASRSILRLEAAAGVAAATAEVTVGAVAVKAAVEATVGAMEAEATAAEESAAAG